MVSFYPNSTERVGKPDFRGFPANNNFKVKNGQVLRFPRPRLDKFLYRKAAQFAVKKAIPFVVRNNPYFRLLTTAIDLYDIYNNLTFDGTRWYPDPSKGWSSVLVCGDYPEYYDHISSAGGCLSGQALTAREFTTPIPNYVKNVGTHRRMFVGSTRFRTVEYFSRPSYTGDTDWFSEPVYVGDCFQLPLVQDFSVPFRDINSFNRLKDYLNPLNSRGYDIPWREHHNILEQPPQIVINSGCHNVYSLPYTYKREPPTTGTYERKFSTKGLKYAFKIYHGATEVADAIDVTYDCIPDKYKIKNISRKDKIVAIWQYREEIDYNLLINSLLDEQLMDRIIGEGLSRIQRPSETKVHYNPLGVITDRLLEMGY